MAQSGDYYTVPFGNAQLDWGNYRNGTSRSKENGEAYIPIPSEFAQKFKIYNGNHTNNLNILGQNLFNAYDADTSQFIDHFKAQGSSSAGSEYAKQFSISGNLKALGLWLSKKGAHNGSVATITWISSTDIIVKIDN